MQQSATAMLTQMSAGYIPLADPSQPAPYASSLQGIPFIQGGLGQLASMFLQPMLSHMMGQVGMVPMGVGHDQNLYDRIMYQRFQGMIQEAVREAARSDREQFFRSFRGLAAITGTPFGVQQRAAAHSLADMAVTVTPFLAEFMPGFIEQLGGIKGSSVILARRIMEAGRYRIDPVTGRMGMSSESAGRMARNIFADLYSDENLPRMLGISAGQAGALIQELQARGMLGTAATERRWGEWRPDDPRSQAMRAIIEMERHQPDDLARAARAQKVNVSQGLDRLTPEDIDKLALDSTVADRIRSFDTDRVKRSLRSYTAAVAAMRDIFGDMGRPNAPMQELISGLEALTGGSLGQIDPGRLGMMARQTYNLARQTGVPLDNALMLQQHAQARASGLGLEPIFGVQATQGALGFGGAYRAQGHAAHVAWGVFNADQMQQMDANLRVQAAASNLANRMAAAVRLAEQVGGFQEDSAAARYVQAVRTGASTFRDETGQLRSVNISDSEFYRLMQSAQDRQGRPANISSSDIASMLQQRETNREQISNLGLDALVRRLQGDEVRDFIGMSLRGTLQGRLREQLERQGLPAEEARQRANRAADDVYQRANRRIFDLSTEEFSDTQMRNDAIANILREELRAAGHEDVFGDMDEGQQRQFLRQTADRFIGSANVALRSSVFRGHGNVQNVHRLHNRLTLDEADRQQMQARFHAENQKALAPLGRGTILSRAVEALQNVRPDDPNGLQAVIAQALGGIRKQDINRALMPRFRQIQEKRRELEDMQDQVQRESDPEIRASLLDRIRVAQRELHAQAVELVKAGEPFGLFTAEGMSQEDIERFQGEARNLITMQNDIVGLRGGFGQEVDPRDIRYVREHFQGKPIGVAEASAVLLTRKQKDIERISQYIEAEQQVAILKSLGDKADKDKLKEAQKRLDELKLDDRLSKMFNFETAKARQMLGANAPESQVKAEALRAMQAEAGEIDPDQVKAMSAKAEFLSDDEVRSFILMQRRLVPLRPSQEDVKALVEQNQNMLTEREASEILSATLRAARLGVRTDEIEQAADRMNWEIVKKQLAGDAKRSGLVPLAEKHRRWVEAGRPDREKWKDTDGTSYTKEEYERHQNEVQPLYDRLRTPHVVSQAIGALFAERMDRMHTVTEEDRKQFKAMPEFRLPTEDEVQRFVEANPSMRGKSIEDVHQTMIDRMILKKREMDQQERFAKFWSSEEGAAFRERTDRFVQDMENMASRLVQTPQIVQRLGGRAIEYSDILRRDLQRLRELAMLHTSNDMARLLAQNYNISPTTPEGRQTIARVRSEVAAIQQRHLAIGQALREQYGKPGRQFRLGDEHEARSAVIDEEIQDITARAQREGKPVDKDKIQQLQQLKNQDLSPDQLARVRERAMELGREENARRALGIDPEARNLSEFQEALVTGLRFGVGTLDEAIGIYGRERWDRLSPDEKQNVLKRMREGVADRNEAMQLLGLTEEMLNKDPNREEQEMRIKTVQLGLVQDQRIRYLARIDPDKADLSEDEQARYLAVKYGMASLNYARWQMRLPLDRMSEDLQRRVQQRRERMGDREEAKYLLNLSHKRELSKKEMENIIAAISGVGPDTAKAMAILGLKGDPSKLSSEDKNRVWAVQQGLASKEYAAHELGILSKLQENRLSTEEKKQIADKQKEIMSSLARAMDFLRIDRNQVMTDEEQYQVERLARGVGVLRQLSPDQEDAISRYQASTARLQRMAETTGVSLEALEKSATGQDKNLVITPEEKKRLDQARSDYNKAVQSEAALRSQAALLERGRAQLGSDINDEEKNKRRASIDQKLADVRRKIDEAREAQQKAKQSIAQDAQRFGVSPDKYIQRKGFITESGLGEVRDVLNERDRAAKELDQILKEQGLRREDLPGIESIRKRLERMQQEAARREDEDPKAIVRGILQEYGFHPPGDDRVLSKHAEDVAAMMHVPRGKELGRALVETHRSLRKRAEGASKKQGTEAVDEMAKAYFDVLKITDEKKRQEALENFQRKYGFEMKDNVLTPAGQAAWQDFERAIQLQEKTRFLQFGSRRKHSSESDLLSLYSQAFHGVQAEMRQQDQRQQQADVWQRPSRIEGSLNIYFSDGGYRGDLAAFWGGSPGYRPGGR
jgi:hypothetical protein